MSEESEGKVGTAQVGTAPVQTWPISFGYRDIALFTQCQGLVEETDVSVIICEDCFLVRTPLTKNETFKQVTTLYGYLKGFIAGRADEKEGSKVVDVELTTSIQNIGSGKKKSWSKKSKSNIKMTKRDLGPWAGTSDKK